MLLSKNTSRYFLLSFVIVVLDQLTKYAIVQNLAPYQAWPLLPILDFRLMFNTGAAFSMLSDAGGWQRWFFSVLSIAVSIVIVFWIKRLPATRVWEAVALALVLGGAVGNVIDRLRFGHVVDFIFFNYRECDSVVLCYWPAFNLADSAITIGAIMLLVDVVRQHKKIPDDSNGI